MQNNNTHRVPLMKGAPINGYIIDGLLGAGGFSIVYRAHEHQSGKPVVIKEYFPRSDIRRGKEQSLVIPAGKTQTLFNAGIFQFFREARTLKAVSHPHIVQATGFFRENNTAYIVSDAVSGRDLKWFLKTTRTPLDKELLIRIFLPILSSVAQMHRLGYLHLDLKPANILLRAQHGAMLLDFGAAELLGNAMQRSSNYQTLTHGFAPPEQYDRKLPLGAWTDIYALGATMYHAMTYRLPEKAKGEGKEAALHESMVKQYPENIVNAINLALKHDLQARHQTIDDFSAALLEHTDWEDLMHYEQVKLGFYRQYEEESLLALLA